MMKKKVFALAMISALCLSSCSYKEFENSLKSTFRDSSSEEHEEYENPASITDNSASDHSADDNSSGSGNVYLPGDTVSQTMPVGDDEMQYTVNKMEIVHNINDLNLNSDDFYWMDSPEVDSEGNILDSEGKKNCFLALYFTVKNCNINLSTEQEEYPLCIESHIASESNILDPNGPFLEEAVYFSGAPDDEDIRRKRYLWFRLDPGTEMDAVVGWIIPESMLSEPLYYVMNSGGDAELYEYIWLNRDQEGGV